MDQDSVDIRDGEVEVTYKPESQPQEQPWANRFEGKRLLIPKIVDLQVLGDWGMRNTINEIITTQF